MRDNFERKMREIFGGRLLDLSLRGSHLRGEAGRGSDMDYFILLDRIENEDLLAIEELSRSYAVSPFLFSRDEFARLSSAARFQFFCENRELFNKMGFPPPKAEDGGELIRRNFEDVLHACRHYLLEPHEPSLIIKRIFYYIKTIDFSLRALMLLKTNLYPGTRKALRGFVFDMPEALWILDVIETWGEKKVEYEKDPGHFLLQLDLTLRMLLPKVLP